MKIPSGSKLCFCGGICTVVILSDGEVSLEINERGFRGESVDMMKYKAVVWGDSGVTGYRGMGWVHQMKRLDNGNTWQFLNGGIEGDSDFNL